MVDSCERMLDSNFRYAILAAYPIVNPISMRVRVGCISSENVVCEQDASCEDRTPAPVFGPDLLPSVLVWSLASRCFTCLCYSCSCLERQRLGLSRLSSYRCCGLVTIASEFSDHLVMFLNFFPNYSCLQPTGSDVLSLLTTI